jgi:hypothetical protein
MSYSEIYQEVFNFFDEEHGLVLTQSQMEEIINRCAQWIVMIDAIEDNDLQICPICKRNFLSGGVCRNCTDTLCKPINF